MRIVCLSDTHGRHDRIGPIPDGDVLIHAGDLTGHGSPREVAAFAAWFRALPHPIKVVIAGNHDFLFERDPGAARALMHRPDAGVHYLQDEALVLPNGLKLYGSPWQPRFFDWAFNLDRGAPLAARWALIPDDVDILITHGPPHGLLDRNTRGEPVGCEALAERLPALRRLKLHVFGHIHEARGVAERGGVTHINAAALDERYEPWQASAFVICLPSRG
jgi:predicted phosphodiesterase